MSFFHFSNSEIASQEWKSTYVVAQGFSQFEILTTTFILTFFVLDHDEVYENELWSRANAQNVSFKTLYGGQFTLSTQLITLNYSVILSLPRSTTVSIETYPFMRNTISILVEAFYIKNKIKLIHIHSRLTLTIRVQRLIFLSKTPAYPDEPTWVSVLHTGIEHKMFRLIVQILSLNLKRLSQLYIYFSSSIKG